MKMNIQRCGRRFSGGCDQREGELCVSAEFVPNLEEEACGGIQNAKDMSIKLANPERNICQEENH